MDGFSITALIMALSGALTAIGGVILSRSGQRDTARQQVAATTLQERVQEHDVYRDLVTDLRAELERLQLSNDADRARGQRARDANLATIEQLRDTVATLRMLVVAQVAQVADVDPNTLVPPDDADERDEHTD